MSNYFQARSEALKDSQRLNLCAYSHMRPFWVSQGDIYFGSEQPYENKKETFDSSWLEKGIYGRLRWKKLSPRHFHISRTSILQSCAENSAYGQIVPSSKRWSVYDEIRFPKNPHSFANIIFKARSRPLQIIFENREVF